MTHQAIYPFYFSKTLFLLLLTSVLLGSSCGKDDPTPANNLSMTANGESYSTDLAGAAYYQIPYPHNVSIVAPFPLPGEALPYKRLFSLTIVNSQIPITTGTYNTTDNDWDGVETYVAATFDTDVVAQEGYTSEISGTNITVNITTADIRLGGRIAGTFSGKLIDEDTGEILTITNGKFDVMIAQ